MARILVIDDDEPIRQFLERLLRNKGHLVVTADNGAMGLKILSKEKFDLVITDIFMPEKEGMETIIEVKREFPSVKIIAMSGGDRQGFDYLPMAKPLGADASLNKPFNNEDMIRQVDVLLGQPSK